MDIHAVTQCPPLDGMVCATPGTVEEILVAIPHKISVYIVHSLHHEMGFHDANDFVFSLELIYLSSTRFSTLLVNPIY